MVTIGALWLPILLSAVFVFIASSVIWMILPHHKGDFQKLPDEEAARAALKNVAPGQYLIPYSASMKAMKDPEFVRKMNEGPYGILTIGPAGGSQMGKNMAIWFIYSVVVSVFVAYLASRTLAPGAEYLSVFRVAGATAWLAYGFAHIGDAVWFSRPWRSVVMHLIDALVYALLTAGAFGWLWPK